jgi:hypothetical protein
VDFVKALKYPYLNPITCLVVPGLVVYVDIILIFTLVFVVAFILFMMIPGLADQVSFQKIADIPGGLLRWIASDDDFSARDFADLSSGGGRWNGPLYLIFWMGFEWRLFAHFQQQGLDAPAPGPEIAGYFKDGLKGSLLYIPLSLLMLGLFLPLAAYLYSLWVQYPDLKAVPDSAWMVFAAIFFLSVLFFFLGSFFLGPFFIAPMVHSAQNRTVAGLYDFSRAFHLAATRYGKVLIAFLLIAVAWFIYLAGSIALFIGTCCLGGLLFPFIWEGAFRVTATHLLAQAYDYKEEEFIAKFGRRKN